jgi:tripartite-type tricarboxylate transporter receptor subunit TctC
MKKFLLGIWLLIGIAVTGPALAQSNSSVSFAGKRITIFIGFSPGGIGYDTYGRLMARYIGKYLPGNPAVVPENRPGAGSMSLANYLYNVAPKDGTEIALLSRGVAMDRLINGDQSSAKFDATKFYWLGSMNNEVSGFFISDTAPVKTLQDILDGRPLVVGTTGAGGDPQLYSIVMNSIFGTKLRMISSSPGMNEILLAMERSEVDGVAAYSWAAARTASAQELKDGKLKVVLQLALQKHPDLPDVPLVTDLVKNPQDKDVLQLIFSRQSMGRPFAAPPGLDPAVAEALRQAFAKAMHDPDLIAEAEKIGLEVNFVSGEDVQALVGHVYAFSPDVIALAQKIGAAK